MRSDSLKKKTIKKISKIDIKDLLREVSCEWDVYIPQTKFGGDVWFEPLPKASKDFDDALMGMTLEDVDMVISPKEIFFPQLEPLFDFHEGKIREVIESSPKFLLGVKSCDLQGILFADDFFSRNVRDFYYGNRIKERFIVTIGCLQPPRPDACFCTSTHTGPFAKKGYDLQFVDTGDAYLVEVGSEKGKEFLVRFNTFFIDAPDTADRRIEQIKSKASASIRLKVDFEEALSLMGSKDYVPEEIYRRIGERCIYCGGCLYVCPTCTCFNVFDDAKGEQGTRFRNWDACVFSGYTREASGHNPRQDKWLRTSRRYEHKLKHDCELSGMSGCVGCGRCLSSCPVNIGMSSFIREIMEQKNEK